MSITVGIIGCGNIARFHVEGWLQAGAHVAWACDLDPVAAQRVAERTGARTTSDHRELLADGAVDAIDVTTVTRAHKPICLDAITAGKAVVCEKTLAENADDALAIVRAAEAGGRPFFTSYMKRFIPAVEHMQSLLPAIGPIIAADVRCWQPWGDLWTAMPTSGWGHTPPGGSSSIVRGSGGGVLICCGSHVIDLLLHCFGRPRRCYATTTVLPGRDYELQATALLHLDHGPVTLSVIGHSHSRTGAMHDGWDEGIDVVGVHGRLELRTAKWDDQDHKPSLLRHYDEASGSWTEHRFPAVSPFVRAMAAFAADIAAGTQRTQSRWTGYEVDEVIAALDASARSGQAVDVGWRDGQAVDVACAGGAASSAVAS